MQLFIKFIIITATDSFSIHKRIEGGATESVLQVQHKFMCFSIHKRIEGGATNVIVNSENKLFVFQYPQADRRGCNGDEAGDKTHG